MIKPDPVVHVIDDDDAARDSLAFLLKTVGFSVRTYNSAVAFLDSPPGIEGDCIVTDLRMPEIDGLQLLRRLRALNIGLPVIVTTGQGDVPLALEAIKLGAMDFIEKPSERHDKNGSHKPLPPSAHDVASRAVGRSASLG